MAKLGIATTPDSLNRESSSLVIGFALGLTRAQQAWLKKKENESSPPRIA